jgi:hypothetical protein
MKKVKTRADKDKYGELVFDTGNTPSEQYMKPLILAWNREYSKAFTIYKLILSDLNREFTTLGGDPLKLFGQINQKLMLVQHTESKRWYRLPTKEVAQGMELTYGDRYLVGNEYARSEQSLLDCDI